MDQLTRLRMQLFGAWCVIGYIVLILVDWELVAGFLPPLAPTASKEEVVALFAADHTRIRIGMVMFSALVFIPFVGVMSQRLRASKAARAC